MKTNTTTEAVNTTNTTIINKEENTMTENTTMTNAQLLDAINAEGVTASEQAKLLNTLKANLTEEAKSTAKAEIKRLAELSKVDKAAFFTEFMAHPYVDAERIKLNAKTWDYEITGAKKPVYFEQVDGEAGDTIAAKKNYRRMTGRFTHNLYMLTCADLSEGVDKDKQKKTTTCNVEAKIDGVDFSKSSLGELTKQLSAIAGAIFPEEMIPLMRRADVRYIVKGFTKAKDGTVRTSNERIVSRLMWDAFAKATAHEGYEVESGANCHKEKKEKKTVQKTANDQNSEKYEAELSKSGAGMASLEPAKEIDKGMTKKAEKSAA